MTLPSHIKLTPEQAVAGWMRESLLSYAIAMYPNFRVGPHHRLIANKLQQIQRGEIDRLMILAPPRHGKSMLTSEFFPAWSMGNQPDSQIMHVTYGQQLADSFGRKIRNQLTEPKFKLAFPGCNLSQDSQSVQAFNTDERGAYVAVGVGGSVTGKGADCLVAGTKVQTNYGLINIENLEAFTNSVKILSVNTVDGTLSYEDCQAFRRSVGTGIYRVTTASGRMVEATGEHLFFVSGKGYIKAVELAAGDNLLCAVWPGEDQTVIRGGQGNQQELQGVLLRQGLQCGSSRCEEQAQVHRLQCPGGEEDTQVLRSMQAAPDSGRQEQEIPRGHCEVSGLCGDISGCLAGRKEFEGAGLLRKEMCVGGSFQPDAWEEQSQVEEWSESTQDAHQLCASLSQAETSHSQERWESVRGMQQVRYKDGGSSHRWGEYSQHLIESGSAVRELPQCSTQVDGFWSGYDQVVMVERVRESDTVYDIQVANNHNFFANGVLVHNCLLIDDPIKNRQDAESEVMRTNLIDFYKSTAFTRLMPGGRIVLIQTRWHPKDLAGYLLENEPDQWTVINLPALAEEGDMLGRLPGQALWPEQFDETALNRIHQSIGEREWASLYQQRPVPAAGNLVKRSHFQYAKAPAAAIVTLGVDLAISEKENADYTSIVATAKDTFGKIYQKDAIKDRLSFQGVIDMIMHMAQKHQPSAIAIEVVQYQAAVVQELMRTTSLPIVPIRPDRDKLTRFYPLLLRYENGMVYHDDGLPRWFEEDLLMFPADGRDTSDAAAYAFMVHDDLPQNRVYVPQGSINSFDPDIGY